MKAGLLVLIIVVAVVVVALVIALVRARRSARLRSQFGPEYDRAVAGSGSRGAAESELEARRQRRERLEIVPLDTAARDRYLREWRLVQARFVDSPGDATRSADLLISRVMRERGYPVEDFEQRAADVSVDHPQVVDDYRAAHAIAEANQRSEATTEDLRQALVHYRSLFEDLLEVSEGEEERPTDVPPGAAPAPSPERRTTEEAR
jgi:predicted nucleic acid-binding protein